MSIFADLPASPYFRLMRLHQRAGIWLLWWPCAWSLALHGQSLSLARLAWLMLLFALGAALMRAAGCILNDIADRRFDAQVERTRARPLASGELSVRQALGLLAVLLALSGGIAWMLGMKAVLWSAAALPLVALYPLAKRMTGWPQLVLGLTFNWGALVGAVAVTGGITPASLFLYGGCVLWTLGYDTIYAHQDKTDDARIGVRSTALTLGAHSRAFAMLAYANACALWWLAAWIQFPFPGVFIAPAAACLAMLAALLYQAARVNLDAPAACMRAFRSNIYAGWLLLAGYLAPSFFATI